ncbi:hypothetical protein [Williamsia phyllosphaerae]|uniref:Uncharacterized protein n=1 Tax=Williamsia phyllosphaerae TaxID=885042 RepID=A0ABQ1V5P1_9NOCA|nr:hypothetical protein [Williamsia phyllosphaerae]GGF37093.1 hypothetical protein GCM10007298_36030 [Williamsia phyllosphaerae]
MTAGSRVEPATASRHDVRFLPEFVDFVYALGFYLVCAFLGLLPSTIGRPLLLRYVTWAAAMDEERAR